MLTTEILFIFLWKNYVSPRKPVRVRANVLRKVIPGLSSQLGMAVPRWPEKSGPWGIRMFSPRSVWSQAAPTHPGRATPSPTCPGFLGRETGLGHPGVTQ